MSYFKNAPELLSHGNTRVREAAIRIIDAGLEKADPGKAARALVHLSGDTLSVGDLRYDLAKYRRVILLGTGKATYPIAKALEDILGERIADGVIICKYGQEGALSRSRLFFSSHPIPDENGMAAAREALALAKTTGPGDIVFGCVTGGSSALMPLPVEGVTLDDKKKVNRLLLTCGANIIEINAVRKHLSQVKGGFLARAVHPEAELVNLTVSDVIGDPLDYITCPTVPDTSSFDDARRTLTKYELWEKVPASVAAYLRSAGPAQETPKAADLSRHHLHNFIIVPGTAAVDGAAAEARRAGLSVMVLSTMLEGESRELGGTFAAIAKEILLTGRPVSAPCVVLGGGETTVRIEGGAAGEGGPNQEFALGAAPWIDGAGDVVVVGQDSDGTDGPTELAGGMVCDGTMCRARELGVDVFGALRRHDVAPALRALGDAVVTGATGTNVNDLKVMVVLPKA